MTVISTGEIILVVRVNGDHLPSINCTANNVTSPGCSCFHNDTTIRCSFSSFQSALNHLKNNSVVYIKTNFVTLQSKVMLNHLYNISIVGINNSTVDCDNKGCLQFESCDQISIEDVVWNNCSCGNGPKPLTAGITVWNSKRLDIKRCTFQNCLLTAVRVENVYETINFDQVKFESNNIMYSSRNKPTSSINSAAGLAIEISNMTDCDTVNISIANSLFSDNRNINCTLCAYAGALHIYVGAVNHLNVSITNTTFTGNIVESGTNSLFNGEASAVRIWLRDVAKPFILLAFLHFSSNHHNSTSKDHVNVLTVSNQYSEIERTPHTKPGTVKLISCTFRENTADIIAFFTGFVNALMQDCSFSGNKILTKSNHVPLPHIRAIVIMIIQMSYAGESYLNISTSNFTNNVDGSAIMILPNQYSRTSNQFPFIHISYSNLLVKNNTFSSKEHSPVGLLSFLFVYIFSVNITDVIIVDNHVFGNVGGVNFNNALQYSYHGTTIVNILNLVFENNTMTRSHGAAIWISATALPDVHYLIANSTFKNTVGAKSIIYSFGTITLAGNIEFANNSGTAVYITLGQTLNITGNVTCENNISEDGGAIYLDDSSIVHFSKFSRVMFTNNIATRYGGAIFVYVSNCSTTSIVDQSRMISFGDNNIAVLAGDDIYYSISHACNHTYQKLILKKERTITSPDNLVPNASVATKLNNTTYYVINDLIMLGQQVSIPVCLQDMNGNATGSVSFKIKVLNSNYSIDGTDIIMVGCKKLHGAVDFMLHGDTEPISNVGTEIQLTSLYDNTFDWRPITVNLLVNVTQCQLGFHFDSRQKKCMCYTTNGIVSCSGSNSSIERGYWFGTVRNKSTVTTCPLNYCYFTACSINTEICPLYHQTSKNNQCREHRIGSACSECNNGYSLSFDSVECINDDRCTIGQTVLILIVSSLYWIVITVSIFVIMHFKILIGYFYGITFYYSVINILLGQIFYFSDWLHNLVMIISSAAKLIPQFLGKFCFIQGMSGIDQQFIHYVHPLAVLSILVTISVAARFSIRLTSFVSRGGVINAICFILLLSYTSITSTSLLLLRPLKFTEIDQFYTYLSPDIEYFHGRHAVYGVIAILCEVVIVIGLPLLLLLQPFLNHKINFIRIMPLLDQFQSCYKNKFRWFASYYMVCQQIIIALATLNVANYFTLYMLFIACLVMNLIVVTLKPYKSNKLNIFDGFVLHIMLLLIVLQTASHVNSFSSVAITTMAYILVLLPFTVYLMAGLAYAFMVYVSNYSTKSDIYDDQSRLLGEHVHYGTCST